MLVSHMVFCSCLEMRSVSSTIQSNVSENEKENQSFVTRKATEIGQANTPGFVRNIKNRIYIQSHGLHLSWF